MESVTRRKIILHVAVTLDGFIEGPNGELDWLVRDETIDFLDILTEILSDKDAILYGRVSYEKWGNYVPDSVDEKLRAAYDRLHSMKKYVVSRTMLKDGTGAEFLNSDIKLVVDNIQSKPGKNIWLYGGRRLIATLMDLDLVDEYRLAVHPVILGKGVPLFENIETRHRLELIEAKSHPSGVVQLHYSRRNDG